MRKPIVAGNWKMNGSRESVSELVSEIISVGTLPCDVFICPPSVFFDLVGSQVADSPMDMGAQNIDWRESGAYTGEISAAMVKQSGCKYALVGHSERRTLFHETDVEVAKKFKAALDVGMTPVLCLGETLQQRQSGDTEEVVSSQLKTVMQTLSVAEFGQGIVAYEPIWAIGTGETATPALAAEVHGVIRGLLQDQAPVLGDEMRILYGGSVNASNAAGLFAEADIDGALVGGASLISEDFVAICRATGTN